VFDRRFMFPDKVLQAITEYGCTTFAGVPTVYNALLRRSNIRGIAMPCLRRFLQLEGLGVQRIREMREVFPLIKFYVMYGQTKQPLGYRVWNRNAGGESGSVADLWTTDGSDRR